MRTNEEVKKIFELHEAGINVLQISKRLKIPRSTCRDILKTNKSFENYLSVKKSFHEIDWTQLDKSAYAFLLGEYLGDGHINKTKTQINGRCVFKIRIFQDLKYPNIVQEIYDALQSILKNKINVLYNGKCVTIYGYSSLLHDLFPQHGRPKMKHQRLIELKEWQWQIVQDFPFEFIKGLIYSDGCIFWSKQSNQYIFEFSNQSEDIKRIYETVLGELGIPNSRNKRGVNVRVTNKLACEVLLEKIPLKS